MPWIKRNLVFVICCAVAVVLLGVAGFFAWSNSDKDASVQEALTGQTQEYERLRNITPAPTTETINELKSEQQKLKDFRKELSTVFVPAPKFAPTDDQGFKNHLEKIVGELTAAAAAANVQLPQVTAGKYGFTFSNHRTQFQFDKASIEPWMGQLADIRSICSILYESRVNAIDNIQRVALNPRFDTAGLGGEYLTASITTNQMGVFMPYSVTFRCFSGELATVMNAMSRATNFIIIKSVNTVTSREGMPSASVAPVQTYPSRAYTPPPQAPPEVVLPVGIAGGASPRPQPTRPVAQQPIARAPVQPSATTVLSEQPLSVTLLLEIVKLNATQ